MSERRTQGFTVAEMLVVISVAALLAALLFPQAKTMVLRAGQAKCGLQLRGIGAAIQSYANDNDGALPYALYAKTVPGFSDWPTWEDYLVTYIEPSATPMKTWTAYKRAFFCPSTPSGAATNQNLETHGYSTSYACNEDIFTSANFSTKPNGVFSALRMVQIHLPAQNAILACANGHPTFNYGNVDDPNTLGFGKHPGGANVLFLDGHVEAATTNTVRTQAAWSTQGGVKVLRN